MTNIEPISVLHKADRRTYEREREIEKLISTVKKSCQSIQKGEIYSEDEFDKMMDKLHFLKKRCASLKESTPIMTNIIFYG